MELLENFFHGRTLLILIIFGMFGLTYWWMTFQKQLNLRLWEAVLLAVGHFVVGIVVMKLWAILEVGGDMEKAANMRLYGAMFLMPPMYYLWARCTKRDPMLTMDIATICCVIGLIVGRVNCLITGCCEGIPVIFGSDVRWPLREIEIVYCVAFIIWFGRKALKNKEHGRVLPNLMISYGAMRFIMEWVREEYTGQVGAFHLAHIWSLLAMAIGTVMLYKVRKSIQPGGNRRNDAKSENLAKGGK